ncbi:MAG: excinuclease ABC subunit UvrA, partial [Thermodesulfobacteriota bacterium]
MSKTKNSDGFIEVKGARENNLKNIDVSIPRNKFTVITGLSGSGKSSLAFDTIYREGLRRYIDCLSTYARQFLERLERPDMDDIEGLPTPIAIESRNNIRNSRSTVGTTTEIYDYIRLLFAKIGKTYCPICGRKVVEHSPQSIAELAIENYLNERLIISFPIDKQSDYETYMRKGFTRIYNEGKSLEIESVEKELKNHEIIADRITIKTDSRSRLTEAIETAFRESETIFLHILDKADLNFSRELSCHNCKISFKKPTPNFFSFNSPYGACEECKGFGNNLEINPELLIQNDKLSIAGGAVEPFEKPSYKHEKKKLLQFCNDEGINTGTSLLNLTQSEKDLILNGNSSYCGVKGYFKKLERKSYKMHIRVFLSRYRSPFECKSCKGSRLKEEALWVRINNKNISDICTISIKELCGFFSKLKLSKHELDIASEILKEINSRTDFLLSVGLEYLTLARLSRTLSGGEAQRINLACQLGSKLTETLYVLDEPSIGLHPRDIDQLNKLIKELKSRNNTVLLIEHDLDTIRSADYIVELGPKSGYAGGKLIYQGTNENFMNSNINSITKKYLSNEKNIALPAKRRKIGADYLKIVNASENNLKNIDVKIPLKAFVCITGVSGSGKSSLINDVLYNSLSRQFNGGGIEKIGRHKEIIGIEKISDVVILDQAPVGKSSRSNPVTYIKAYDDIRKILSDTVQAKLKGLTASHFSFNVDGGRCEKCRGDGSHTVEMHFLADVSII